MYSIEADHMLWSSYFLAFYGNRCRDIYFRKSQEIITLTFYLFFTKKPRVDKKGQILPNNITNYNSYAFHFSYAMHVHSKNVNISIVKNIFLKNVIYADFTS